MFDIKCESLNDKIATFFKRNMKAVAFIFEIETKTNNQRED